MWVRLKWVWAKLGEEIREFHVGETHLNRLSEFTGSRESTSAMISGGSLFLRTEQPSFSLSDIIIKWFFLCLGFDQSKLPRHHLLVPRNSIPS